ncbi:EF-hand domain-containing protein [Pseudaminobacter soli (ex Li et al. 2025)]|uniref:EF-hand domain-containing protein n=1 Tax=Pseudaminobacter soli (ex Li et al. 2025) TaxID=1295366 RepID=A0A2P7SB56_9HYPH|nr:EF-hand domain-containing protein [Mesorhizobium soli]PSJ59723.1 hypothetical protein C7I85_15325 [Mesorhizobium soli]
MTSMLLKSLTLSAVLVTTGMMTSAFAQSAEDQNNPVVGQAAPPSDEYYDEQPEDQGPGMMPPEQQMPPRMMPQPRMPGTMPGMPGGMPGQIQGRPHMMPPGQMMERMHGRRIPLPLKVLFAMADTDNDGSLTFAEVSVVMKRLFDAIDTKKDGRITLEDIQAFLRR